MSILRWRFLVGPLVTIVAGVGFLLIDRYLYSVPTPGSLLFFSVLFAAYVGGVIPGLVSAAFCLTFSAVLLSEPGQFLVLQPENLKRWTVLMLVAPGTALAVGTLQSRARRERERMVAAHRELDTVRAALDQVDYGVMLLDQDLRVQLMNHAIFRNGALRQRAPGEKPPLAELLREFATSGVYSVPADKIDRFVAKSLKIVRTGDPTPIDLHLSDGKIVRFKCNILPDGGRMLTYADVTDIVRNAEQLEQLATTDGLTALYNHRQFMKLAEREWNRFRRHGRPLSLLMFDIDFFKSFNDRFGHEVGDQVLFHVAALSCEERRETDIVARIGGEEFAILLPETGIDDAGAAAERLLKHIEESDLQCDGQNMTVTVSIGIAEAQLDMRDIGDLLKNADQALYIAKRTGRNRIVPARKRPLAIVPAVKVPLQSA
jgi:diguanylate cyclase (GGDEF)-like protein